MTSEGHPSVDRTDQEMPKEELIFVSQLNRLVLEPLRSPAKKQYQLTRV